MDLVDGIICCGAVCIDREHVQEEVDKIVDAVVRLVLLHPREQRHDDLTEIWLQCWLTEQKHSAQRRQSDKQVRRKRVRTKGHAARRSAGARSPTSAKKFKLYK